MIFFNQPRIDQLNIPNSQGECGKITQLYGATSAQPSITNNVGKYSLNI